ncbi:hypothetical protein [Croceicoccus bisphenolivorans]|uniref:hypothetical protein n=1 Tax=Croceicoccus bisphenolivorans TaxID=1783232 RepID=UPI00082EE8D3|nr:hypothetical protein [Croceicoccus bisphenolivorans]
METPREAVEDTLAQLAAALPDLGFEAKSGLKLVRRHGDLTQEIHAQPDRANRAGEVVRMRFSAMLQSALAKRWAKAQTDPELHAEGPWAGVIDTRQMHFEEGLNGRDFDVVNPDDRPFVADTVAAKVREDIMPWFDTMGDPVAALATLGTGVANEKWVLRHALAHGYDAEARDALAQRCLRWPEFGQLFAQYAIQIRANGYPQGYSDATEELAAFAVAAQIAP